MKGIINNYLSIFYIMTDNLQRRNAQIIENIKSLQTTEIKLYDRLESTTLNSEQKQEIIDKINQISQMRINLYANLKDMYSYYQEDVSVSRNAMNDQLVSLDLIENELNGSRRRLNLVEMQKNNKIRLVEINTFYGKRYNAHKEIMQIIVIVCIPVLILTILASKGLIPPKINTLLTGIIIIIGLYIIGAKVIDLFNRDNINFDEYDWYFNKNDAPNSSVQSNMNVDPWATPSLTCIGSECCDDNNIYDEIQNKCIPNVNLKSKEETEAFEVLGKYASSANYPGTRLQGNIMSYNS
jgi:hypothetical protein